MKKIISISFLDDFFMKAMTARPLANFIHETDSESENDRFRQVPSDFEDSGSEVCTDWLDGEVDSFKARVVSVESIEVSSGGE